MILIHFARKFMKPRFINVWLDWPGSACPHSWVTLLPWIRALLGLTALAFSVMEARVRRWSNSKCSLSLTVMSWKWVNEKAMNMKGWLVTSDTSHCLRNLLESHKGRHRTTYSRLWIHLAQVHFPVTGFWSQHVSCRHICPTQGQYSILHSEFFVMNTQIIIIIID